MPAPTGQIGPFQDRPACSFDSVLGATLLYIVVKSGTAPGLYTFEIFRNDVGGYMPDTLFLNVIDDHDHTMSMEHERKMCESGNAGYEVPGDGLPDDSTRDLHPFEKELYIELDYQTRYSPYDLDTVILVLEQILETAGMHVHVIVDDHIIPQFSLDALADIQRLMQGCRDSLFALHLAIVDVDLRAFGGDQYGLAVQVLDVSEAIGGLDCRQLAGDTNQLKKCGAIVSGMSIYDDFTDGGPDMYDQWVDPEHAIAFMCAHEIGHALGLTEHSDQIGVMHPVLSLSDHETAGDFSDHNHFTLEEMFGYVGCFPQHHSGMNLRDVLGVHTVDAGS